LNRLLSYGFIFALIYLAILEGDATDHVMLIQGFAFSLIVAYLAFFLTWVTLDATLPVIVVGTAILGFGGWILAIAVVVFFITGSLFSRLNRDLETPDNGSLLPDCRFGPMDSGLLFSVFFGFYFRSTCFSALLLV
jgi:hypothetical protein